MKEANSPIPDQARTLAADLWDDSIRCDFEAFKLRVAAVLSTAQTTGSAPESEWITKLRRELMMSKMTHNFTFSRDQVIEMLGGQFALLAASTGGDRT